MLRQCVDPAGPWNACCAGESTPRPGQQSAGDANDLEGRPLHLKQPSEETPRKNKARPNEAGNASSVNDASCHAHTDEVSVSKEVAELEGIILTETLPAEHEQREAEATSVTECGDPKKLMASAAVQEPKACEFGEVYVSQGSMASRRKEVGAMRLFCEDMARTFCVSQVVGLVFGLVLYVICMNVELDEQYPKANDMLAVTVLVGIFWMFEVLPLPATSLLPVVLMPFSGIMTSSTASSSYWGWVQMLFLGAFLVDIAVEHVGLHRRIALWVLRRVGVERPLVVVMVFMLISYFLSMWCSNTATTVMLVPFATGLIESATTLPGGSIASPDIHPKGTSATTDEVGRRFGAAALLAIAYGSTAGGIATLIGTPTNGVLAGLPIATDAVNSREWFLFAAPISVLLALLIGLTLYATFVRGIKLSLDPNVVNKAYTDLGSIGRDELFVALVQFVQFFAFLIRQDIINDPEVTGSKDLKGVNDATLACAAAALLFFLPSERNPGEVLLPWRVAQERLPWGVLLLMGGGFAIAQGFQDSKLTKYIGDVLASFATDISSLGLTFLITTVVCFLTEVTSNTATASIILPILASVASETLLHPCSLLLPATVACSIAFMLPAATPPNSVVFATPWVNIRDFVSAGLALNLLTIALAAPLIHIMAQAVYDSGGPFPEWACLPKTCRWLPVPGVVDGRDVTSQACALLGNSTCRLRSGTVMNYTSVLAGGM